MKLPIDLVIFDMVGTTVQDNGEAPEAFRAALLEFGITVDEDSISKIRGAAKREAICNLLGPGQADRAEAAYLRFAELLAARFQLHASPISGAEDVFALLRGHHIAIALNTGFDRATTDLLIDALGWSGADFAGIICADDVERSRPAPDMIRAAMKAAQVGDPARAMNVGDTRLDLEAGKAAGVAFNVGVCGGAHGRDVLSAAPHTHLIGTIADLPGLLPNMGGAV